MAQKIRIQLFRRVSLKIGCESVNLGDNVLKARWPACMKMDHDFQIY